MSTITVYAGPCSVESREQFDEIAACIEGLGLHWVRGGAYKPRRSPHAFQGLGREGLEIMAESARARNLKVMSEIMDPADCDLFEELADGFQIGTRNMANYALLRHVGARAAKLGRPVLLKRGMASTIQEWLDASEYLVQEGCRDIIMCERGIRTFETATRFTLDISAVPVLHEQSNLPVCVDVSHPAGHGSLVPSLARAAVAAGCDALMIEVHPDPPKALSDGPQQITCREFERLIEDLRVLSAVLGKELA